MFGLFLVFFCCFVSLLFVSVWFGLILCLLLPFVFFSIRFAVEAPCRFLFSFHFCGDYMLYDTSLARNIRVVYTSIRIPRGPYIYAQNGRWWYAVSSRLVSPLIGDDVRFICFCFCFVCFAGLLAMATIPLIAFAGIVQMAMMTGGYGDNDVSQEYACGLHSCILNVESEHECSLLVLAPCSRLLVEYVHEAFLFVFLASCFPLIGRL